MKIADGILLIAFTLLLVNWLIEYKIQQKRTSPTLCSHCQASIVDPAFKATEATTPTPIVAESYVNDPIVEVAQKMLKEYNMTMADEMTYSFKVLPSKFEAFDTASHYAPFK